MNWRGRKEERKKISTRYVHCLFFLYYCMIFCAFINKILSVKINKWYGIVLVMLSSRIWLPWKPTCCYNVLSFESTESIYANANPSTGSKSGWLQLHLPSNPTLPCARPVSRCGLWRGNSAGEALAEPLRKKSDSQTGDNKIKKKTDMCLNVLWIKCVTFCSFVIGVVFLLQKVSKNQEGFIIVILCKFFLMQRGSNKYNKI